MSKNKERIMYLSKDNGFDEVAWLKKEVTTINWEIDELTKMLKKSKENPNIFPLTMKPPNCNVTFSYDDRFEIKEELEAIKYWRDKHRKELKEVHGINIPKSKSEKSKGKGKGWHGDPERHSKARKTGKADTQDNKPIAWFTSKGRHIPIYEGQSREEAFKNTFKREPTKKESVLAKVEKLKQEKKEPQPEPESEPEPKEPLKKETSKNKEMNKPIEKKINQTKKMSEKKKKKSQWDKFIEGLLRRIIARLSRAPKNDFNEIRWGNEWISYLYSKAPPKQVNRMIRLITQDEMHPNEYSGEYKDVFIEIYKNEMKKVKDPNIKLYKDYRKVMLEKAEKYKVKDPMKRYNELKKEEMDRYKEWLDEKYNDLEFKKMNLKAYEKGGWEGAVDDPEELKNLKKQLNLENKEKTKGRGWHGESERHSKARKTGKADFIANIYDFIEDALAQSGTYYCTICGRSHYYNSEIGMEHKGSSIKAKAMAKSAVEAYLQARQREGQRRKTKKEYELPKEREHEGSKWILSKPHVFTQSTEAKRALRVLQKENPHLNFKMFTEEKGIRGIHGIYYQDTGKMKQSKKKIATPKEKQAFEAILSQIEGGEPEKKTTQPKRKVLLTKAERENELKKIQKISGIKIKTKEEWERSEAQPGQKYSDYFRYASKKASQEARVKQINALIRKAEKQRQEEEKKKIIKTMKNDLTSDFVDIGDFYDITLDFNVNGDFSVMRGNLSRAGPFTYIKDGKEVILTKDWENLKEVFGKTTYIPVRGTTGYGSHRSKEIGYSTNFSFNEDTKQIEGDVVLFDDLKNLTPLTKEGTQYEVSIGFKDDVDDNNIQWIEYLDHLAISLMNKEKGRCSSSGGLPCNVGLKKNVT